MKKFLCFSLMLAAAFCGAQSGDENPGSLWPQSYVNPLVDRTAKRVGDLLTVLISEASTASFAASTSTSKRDQTQIDRTRVPLLDRLNIGILNDLLSQQSVGASSTASGTGQTTQSGRLSSRMTVIVREVLPNGALVIEGTRAVRVNKETQTFKLTGVVRPDDVRSDNTVLSESIAEARIQLDGKGAIAARQRRGILTQLLDWLF